jgi:hypothetical protein
MGEDLESGSMSSDVTSVPVMKFYRGLIVCPHLRLRKEGSRPVRDPYPPGNGR